ncbi:hypothetical protein DPMN_159593 [Dreissena polymorpha]|uniref:Short-chain dehydrogenase n=2 Tax=Dreissena polymorpha TaxID=45954 RepID=A0A9D4ENJ6_DREPO|nr:hypothetical protein DPMN_159593 [Dreissena polymorpha]
MAAIDRIHEDFPNAKIDFIQLDLASLQSVKSFAEEFLSRDLPLHILINNAGIMMPPYEETVDGFESQFQVNFLSHFYLTQLLLAKLTQSGKDERWSRIVNVSSYMHRIGRPFITKLGQRAQTWFEYSSHKAYADSKLLIVAATLALHHQLRASGAPVSASAIHPGIVTSGLWRHLTWVHRKPISLLGKYIFLTPEKGAVTALFSALSPDLEGKSGCYYDKSANTIPASLTQDAQFQTEVWSKSLSLIDSCVQSSE